MISKSDPPAQVVTVTKTVVLVPDDDYFVCAAPMEIPEDLSTVTNKWVAQFIAKTYYGQEQCQDQLLLVKEYLIQQKNLYDNTNKKATNK